MKKLPNSKVETAKKSYLEELKNFESLILNVKLKTAEEIMEDESSQDDKRADKMAATILKLKDDLIRDLIRVIEALKSEVQEESNLLKLDLLSKSEVQEESNLLKLGLLSKLIEESASYFSEESARQLRESFGNIEQALTRLKAEAAQVALNNKISELDSAIDALEEEDFNKESSSEDESLYLLRELKNKLRTALTTKDTTTEAKEKIITEYLTQESDKAEALVAKAREVIEAQELVKEKKAALERLTKNAVPSTDLVLDSKDDNKTKEVILNKIKKIFVKLSSNNKSFENSETFKVALKDELKDLVSKVTNEQNNPIINGDKLEEIAGEIVEKMDTKYLYGQLKLHKKNHKDDLTLDNMKERGWPRAILDATIFVLECLTIILGLMRAFGNNSVVPKTATQQKVVNGAEDISNKFVTQIRKERDKAVKNETALNIFRKQ